ncbi:RluA family pseudouridine synthase [Streptococcus sciuri]|uniref:Pseudouridine synthase n=1 Tax=Streptococcus sciuri TaxID=2973939 RepID=A0ABT2F7U0_9STRE|nr:RluA family pseudouridine synthase [Streptococcus sciuri]MCS4488522.1 RluA family pseudouridine synthase [Streptococcus sciuri]
MVFQVTFQNPYPKLSIKALLEEKLLIPRKIRHFLRIKKHVLINGHLIHWQNKVEQGDSITLIFDDEDYPKKTILSGNKKLVYPIYEDEHLIVVNKPEGMKTHANQPNELALLNHVSAYVGHTCYIVHRLDKETSGLVLFAKNPFILPIINRMLETKVIKRYYWALVEGASFPKIITYKDKIGRHRHDRRKRVIDNKHGQKAITHLKRIKSYPKAQLLQCQLDTGRTHQIRVHLSYHKHPIIGDPLYHSHPKGRLMLHAYQLTLTHPLTGKNLTLYATSDSFKKCLNTQV